MQIAKWGNSLAVRLPAGLVHDLRLKAGDKVALRAVHDDDGNLTLAIERKPSREEFIDSLAKLRWPAPKGFKFNRDELYEREGKD